MSAEFHDVASVQLRRATEWVGLKIRPTRVTLSVRDDGRGFDPAPLRPAHLGLRVMRERAEEVGARLRLVSGPGEGTLIAVEWRGEPSRNEASAGDPPA